MFIDTEEQYCMRYCEQASLMIVQSCLMMSGISDGQRPPKSGNRVASLLIEKECCKGLKRKAENTLNHMSEVICNYGIERHGVCQKAMKEKQG